MTPSSRSQHKFQREQLRAKDALVHSEVLKATAFVKCSDWGRTRRHLECRDVLLKDALAQRFTPVKIQVRCNGKLHHILLTDKGKLVLTGHNITAERALCTMGASKPRCLEIYDLWQDDPVEIRSGRRRRHRYGSTGKSNYTLMPDALRGAYKSRIAKDELANKPIQYPYTRACDKLERTIMQTRDNSAYEVKTSFLGRAVARKFFKLLLTTEIGKEVLRSWNKTKYNFAGMSAYYDKKSCLCNIDFSSWNIQAKSQSLPVYGYIHTGWLRLLKAKMALYQGTIVMNAERVKTTDMITNMETEAVNLTLLKTEGTGEKKLTFGEQTVIIPLSNEWKEVLYAATDED